MKEHLNQRSAQEDRTHLVCFLKTRHDAVDLLRPAAHTHPDREGLLAIYFQFQINKTTKPTAITHSATHEKKSCSVTVIFQESYGPITKY